MNKQTQPSTFRTTIGGQALMEGILMRGPSKQAIVCRTADGLVEKVEDIHPLKEKYPVLGWPIIRGAVALFSSLANGMKALTYSAELLPEDMQGEPDKIDQWIEKHFSGETAQKLIIGVAMVMGVALAMLLFLILPTFLGGLIPAIRDNFYARTLVEGIAKLAIFLVYMAMCAKMPEIARVFAYHGAEHKTIYCYEAGLDLTVENVRPQSRLHPRCGTSFMFVVIIISIIAGAFIRVESTLIRMLIKLLMLPLVIGVTFEINHWVGAHDNFLSRFLSWPGRMIQNITTNEPDDGMIECAIRALELVIPEEKGADAW